MSMREMIISTPGRLASFDAFDARLRTQELKHVQDLIDQAQVQKKIDREQNRIAQQLRLKVDKIKDEVAEVKVHQLPRTVFGFSSIDSRQDQGLKYVAMMHYLEEHGLLDAYYEAEVQTPQEGLAPVGDNDWYVQIPTGQGVDLQVRYSEYPAGGWRYDLRAMPVT